MKRAWSNHARTVETTAQLEALFATRRFAAVNLLALYLRFGPAFGLTPIWWCDAGVDVTWDGRLYKALGASRFKRGIIREIAGVEVDTFDLTIDPWVTAPNPKAPTDPPQVLDVLPGTTMTIPAAADSDLFDRAFVELRTLYLPNPPQWHQTLDVSAGAVLRFVGTVADAKVSRSQVKFTVRSRLDELSSVIPRNVYQPGCLNALYDGVCAVSPSGSFGGKAFQSSHTVIAGSSTTMALTLNSAPSQGDGYFDQGWVEIAAGPFILLRRGIRSQRGTTVKMIQPWPFPLDNGQAVTLQAGCDKTLATCDAKFGNRARFRGFPWIPSPDTAY